MIFFELYKQLDIRLNGIIYKVDPKFRTCGKYAMMENAFIFLGSDHSIAFNINNKKFSLEAPYKNIAKKEDLKDIKWISRDAKEVLVIKLIVASLREWYEIEPFDSIMQFEGIHMELNSKLNDYGIMAYLSKKGMSFYINGQPGSLEEAMSLLLNADELGDAIESLTEWLNDARFYKMTNQDMEAIKRYEALIRYSDPSMEIYTEAAYALGELYYFNNDNKRAFEMLKRCDLKYIKDKNSFFIHVGHTLADEKMKNYFNEIKLYYRGRIDPGFLSKNRQMVEIAASEVADEFPAYEEFCFRLGEQRYNESRALLTSGQISIYDPVIFSGESDLTVSTPQKRYENIRLIRNTLMDSSPEETRDKMLKRAIDELNRGEYQKAFSIYLRLSEDSTSDEEIYTWVNLQIGKLYIFFNEYDKAIKFLDRCVDQNYGVIYRKEDQRILSTHARLAADDFESEPRFRVLIRGRYDNYFARYDQEYFFMKQDKELMERFRLYEKDCLDQAERRLSMIRERNTKKKVDRKKGKSRRRKK